MSFREALTEAWYDKLCIISTSELEIIKTLFENINEKNIDISDVDYLYFYVKKCEGWEPIGGLYSVSFAYREEGEEESFLNLTPIGDFGHMFENVAEANFYALREKIKKEGFAVSDVFKNQEIKAFRIDLEDFYEDEIPHA